MNLYKISQDENCGYDTYDSAVVAAKSEAAAREIHPESMNASETGACLDTMWGDNFYTWAISPESVTVRLLGKAVKGTVEGVISTSFIKEFF